MMKFSKTEVRETKVTNLKVIFLLANKGIVCIRKIEPFISIYSVMRHGSEIEEKKLALEKFADERHFGVFNSDWFMPI